MTTMASLDSIFFLDNVFLALAPTAFGSFRNAVIAIGVFLTFALALTGVALIGLIMTSLISSRRTNDRAIDMSTVYITLAAFFASLWAPFAAAAATFGNALARLLTFIRNNALLLVAVFALALFGWLWSYGHSQIWGGLLRAYSLSVVPLWRVVPLYIFLFLRFIIETAIVWINFLVIRVPSALVTGLFFDVTTCSSDTWTLFFTQLINTGIEFAAAFNAWIGSGQTALFVTPDFVPWGQSVAVLVSTGQAFIACFCSSISIISAPFFQALEDGNPSIPSETSGFVQALNSTLNIPIAFSIDIVRPIVLGVEAVENGEGFFDVIRAMHISFNGTLDTSKRAVNATLYIPDNILQQYYIFIVTEATSDGPLVTSPGAFGRLFSCGIGILWTPLELFKWAVNLFVSAVSLELFTYDGQLRWRLDDVLDTALDVVFCICDFIEWLANSLRAIGDEIAGGEGICVGTSGGDLGGDIGGCIFYIAAATFDFVCCIVKILAQLVVDAVRILLELIIGTIYTFISRVDDSGNDRCDVVSDDNVFYCTIPFNGGGWLFFDYFDFQLGFRRAESGLPTCDRIVCNLPSCDPNINEGDNISCDKSPLYGVGRRCSQFIARCVETTASCAADDDDDGDDDDADDDDDDNGNNNLIPQPTDCEIDDGEGNCQLGLCADKVCTPTGESGDVCDAACGDEECPSIPSRPDYPCACSCHPNIWRAYGTLIVDAFDCIGKWFVASFGEGAQFLRCILVSYISLSVENTLFLIDFFGQLPRIFDDTHNVQLSTREWTRAFEGVCNCLADALISIGDEDVDDWEGLPLFVEAIGLTLRCFCRSVISVFDGVLGIITVIVTAIRSVVVPSLDDILAYVLLVFQGVIELIGAFFHLISAFFYLINQIEPGDAVGVLADLFCNEAKCLAGVAFDVIGLVITCVIGIINAFFFTFICVAFDDLGFDSYEECYKVTVVDILFECSEELFTFLFVLLGELGELILCAIQFASCFFNAAIEPPLCELEEGLCESVNILCLFEDVFCFVGIPVDLGCEAPPCENISFLCSFDAALCGLDLFLLDVLSGLESFLNFMVEGINAITIFVFALCSEIVVIPQEACDDFFNLLPLADFTSGFPFIVDEDFDIPQTCCKDTDDDFDFSINCFDEEFVKVEYDEGSELCKFVQRDGIDFKYACWRYLGIELVLENSPESAETCCEDPITPACDCPDTPPCPPPTPAPPTPAPTPLPPITCDNCAPRCPLLDEVLCDDEPFCFFAGLDCECALMCSSPPTTQPPTPPPTPISCGNCEVQCLFFLTEIPCNAEPFCTFEDSLCLCAPMCIPSPAPTPVPPAPTPMPQIPCGENCEADCLALSEAQCNTQASCSFEFFCDCDLGVCPLGAHYHTWAQTAYGPCDNDCSTIDCGTLTEVSCLNETGCVWDSLGFCSTCNFDACPLQRLGITPGLRAGNFCVQDVFRAIEREFYPRNAMKSWAVGSSTILPFCLDVIANDPNISPRSIWPPYDTIAQSTDGASFTAASCLSYLDSIVQRSDIQSRLSRHGAPPPVSRRHHSTVQKLLKTVDSASGLWFLRFPVALVVNTIRLMGRAATDSTPITVTGDRLFGIAHLQKSPSVCNGDNLPAAIVVDTFRPTIGVVFHAATQALVQVQTKFRTLGTEGVLRQRRSTRSLIRATEYVSRIHKILYKARLGELSGALLRRVATGAVGDAEHLRKRTEQLFFASSQPAVVHTKPVKRTVGTSGALSSWRDAAIQRIEHRMSSLFRQTPSQAIALLGNDNDDDPCSLRSSPWECCPEQVLCANCSVFDRVAWAAQDSLVRIFDYYETDYPDRYLPCIEEASVSVNYMIVPPSQACPSEVCTLPECVTDQDCALSMMANPAAALVCDSFLHRCVHSDASCASGNETLVSGMSCYEETNGTCALGVCDTDLDLCSSTPPSFACDCKCPDTFLTVNKTVPYILSRLHTITVPCQLNITCIRESILPPGTNLTIPDDHEFRGTFVAHKTANGTESNFDVDFLATIDSITNGGGTTIITAIEDFIFGIDQATSSDAFDRFLNEFLFCDYEDDWYCPLTDESPEGCCNDRCEIRKQGVGLFIGFVWALIILFIPLMFFTLCPPCAGCTGILTSVWLFVLVPITFAFGYGGGVLCYTPGPLLLALPVYAGIVGLLGVILQILCCGPAGAICVAVSRGIARVIGLILVAAAFLPGLTTCFGMDSYTLASELVPPCFPTPITMIDRTQPGAQAPCGAFFDDAVNTTLPAIIDCTTTPLLEDTRFRDGLDNIFYIIEQIRPGTNEDLSTSLASGFFSFLQPYAEAHTTAAHESAGPYAETCFYVTLPSIILAAFVTIVQITFALIFLGATIFVLALLMLPCLFAGRTWALMVSQMYDALHGPETDATTDEKEKME